MIARETVVVVSDGVFGGIVPFGRAIRELGAKPVLLTRPAAPQKLATWREIYEEIREVESIGSADALAREAKDAAKDGTLTGLFSAFDGLCLPAAQAAAALGLPHPAIKGLATARNKFATRRALERAGIPSAAHALVSSPADVSRAASGVGFPAVIKPLNGTASHLVQRVDSIEELRDAYAMLSSRIRESFQMLYGNPVAMEGEATPLDAKSTFLVEEFLEGEEYSLEILVRDNVVRHIALFDKFLVEACGFLECGFTSPILRGRPERAEEIWRYTEQCIAATGVDHTAAHVEIIYTGAGPRLVEINAGRPGGQILVRAVLDATGVYLIEEVLALQTGRPAPKSKPPTLQGRVTTFTVFPPRSGRLTRLDGLEAVAALPGVVEVIPYCKVGDQIDADDKEFFAVNVLVGDVEPDALSGLYDRIRAAVGFTVVDERDNETTQSAD